MKKLLLSILFILIVIMIYNWYNRILVFKKYNANVYSYYKENQIDILFTGNSRVFSGISPMYIWDKYGVSSYNRGGNGQYFKITYYFTKEFIKRNKPKLVIIDISFFQTMFRWPPALPQIYHMQFSPLKIQAYLDIFETKKIIDLDIYTNIMQYHTRWKDLNETDFNYLSYFKGFNLPRVFYQSNPQKQYIEKDKHIKWNTLQEESIKYLDDLVEYAKSYGVKILFIKLPSSLSKENIKLDTEFEQLSKQKNWDFINYNNLLDTINFDFNKDLFDWSHLNGYGAKKVLNHLIPYIIEHYNIPNRKNDPVYASWNEDYIKYAIYENKLILQNNNTFSDWKQYAFYDNYTVMLSTNGDVLKKLPDTLKNNLKSFGLTKYNTDKPNMRYAAIIDNNQVFFEEVSNKPVIYKGRMKNIVNLLVSSDGKATINVSGKPRSKNKYGLNFVIYDKVNREIVDSIWIDPAKPDVVRR